MSGTFAIRGLTENDAGEVLALVCSVLCRCETTILTPEEFTSTVDQERQFLRRLADEPGHLALGAFDEQQIVGVLFVERDARQRRSHCGTLSLSVAPHLWGRGIATALVAETLRRVRRDGLLTRIELSWLANNPRSRNLFAHAGFRTEGCKVGSVWIDGVAVDETLMAIDVTPV